METTTLTIEAQNEAPALAVSPDTDPEDVVCGVRAASDQILNGGTPRRRYAGGAWPVWQ